MKILCSKNSQLQSLNLLEFALSIQTLYEQSVRDFLIFILRYSVFTETDQKSRILCDENRAQFSVKYAIRETPVNFLDAWG